MSEHTTIIMHSESVQHLCNLRLEEMEHTTSSSEDKEAQIEYLLNNWEEEWQRIWDSYYLYRRHEFLEENPVKEILTNTPWTEEEIDRQCIEVRADTIFSWSALNELVRAMRRRSIPEGLVNQFVTLTRESYDTSWKVYTAPDSDTLREALEQDRAAQPGHRLHHLLELAQENEATTSHSLNLSEEDYKLLTTSLRQEA